MTPRRLLPRSLDLYRSAAVGGRSAGLPKMLDTFLWRLGPSWQAAPLRRAIQAVSLVLYLYLFFVVAWPYAARFSSQVLPDKEWLPVETFLWLDPLVGLSTAVTARAGNVALMGMAVMLLTSVVLPRGFCGYVCPLGTLIDLFDCVLGKCLPGRKTQPVRSWTNLRFYLLAAVLASSLGGVLLSGFVAAIPVLTRGLLFSAGNVQLGLTKNWGMVPPLTTAVGFSLALFAVVFLLGMLGPRDRLRRPSLVGGLRTATPAASRP